MTDRAVGCPCWGRVALCLALAAGCHTRDTPAIEGVWQLESARRIQPAGDTVPVAVRAGLIIVGRRHYSITWMSDETADVHALSTQPGEARTGERGAWAPSDAERIRRFNSVIVNAGSWEIAAGRLITRPIVALTSDFVGGTGTYECSLRGDTLLLTMVDLRAHDGTQHPSYARDERLELRLHRIE